MVSRLPVLVSNPLLPSCNCSRTKIYSGQVAKHLDKDAELKVLSRQRPCTTSDGQGDPRRDGSFSSSALGKGTVHGHLYVPRMNSEYCLGGGETFCIRSVCPFPLS
ncbi:UNVERIFIED_CONTAM: hypothetical protein K2H54_060912 [Gekko kuhli]